MDIASGMKKGMELLHGRVALVTGGGRGIGKATALALADAGCDVAIHYRSRQAEAEHVAKQIRAAGRRSVAVQAELSDPTSVAEMVRRVRAELGPVTVLINNAGTTVRLPFSKITVEDWDRVMDANLRGAFLVTQAVVPDMAAENFGRIVQVSSASAIQGNAEVPYATAKAAQVAFTMSLAAELGPQGITVNAVLPGVVDTEFHAPGVIQVFQQRMAPRLPLRRLATVEDVADAIMCLVSHPYLTGVRLLVTGGGVMG
jgi:3-oxoacyl-[acyl-carrier protein] reductase